MRITIKSAVTSGGLQLRDPDRALAKKKQAFDDCRVDYIEYVWSLMRSLATPYLDRAAAALLGKSSKKQKTGQTETIVRQGQS